MKGLVCWNGHPWGPEKPGKTQLHWHFHAVKKPKPHRRATCRPSSWQCHLGPAFESSCLRYQICKWRSIHMIPAPAVSVTGSHFSLVRWGPDIMAQRNYLTCQIPDPQNPIVVALFHQVGDDLLCCSRILEQQIINHC